MPKPATQPVKGYRSAHSAGGFVGTRIAGDVKLLLIKNSFDGRWSIPKGHLDPGETSEVAAIREVQEESGVHAEIVELLGKNRYHFRFEDWLVKKRVDVYLLRTNPDTPLRPELFDPQEQLVADARWFTPNDAVNAISYANLRELAKKAASKVEHHV